jgi:phosphonate transport system substrate-binding protein
LTVVVRSIKSAIALLFFLTAASLAQADWRKDIGTFRIGLSASDSNSVSPADLEKLRAVFGKALGMPVEIVVQRDYSALVDAQVSGRIEYAVYSATAYASAWLLCECVEPLVAPELSNGATGTRSTLIVNASVPFTRLDLNGIRVGIAGKDSITGFAIPLATYTVGTRALSQDESFFREFNDLESAMSAFVVGDIDAFFGWTHSNETGPIAGSGLLNSGEDKVLTYAGRSVETKVLWSSKLLRFGPHAVRRELNAEAKSALLSLLSSPEAELLDLLSSIQTGDVKRFVAARQGEYDLAIQTARIAAAVRN